jgi:hypothetical protein
MFAAMRLDMERLNIAAVIKQGTVRSPGRRT